MSEIDFSKMEDQPVFTVAQLEWSEKLEQFSLGGSYAGNYEPSGIQYRIHDHISGRQRFKVYRNGISRKVGQAATLECAKEIAQAHFEVTVNAAIAPAMKDEILRLRAERDELVGIIRGIHDDVKAEPVAGNIGGILWKWMPSIQTALNRARGEA